MDEQVRKQGVFFCKCNYDNFSNMSGTEGYYVKANKWAPLENNKYCMIFYVEAKNVLFM